MGINQDEQRGGAGGARKERREKPWTIRGRYVLLYLCIFARVYALSARAFFLARARA